MISRTATRAKISPVRQGRSNPDRPNTSAIDHAVRVLHSVCCLAGAASLIDDIRADLRAEGIPTAIRRHDTATLFDWLISALSYQGISDQVAAEYMERHGRAQWHDIDAKLAASPTCPKLASYWHFYGCRYDKISRTCSEPDHIDKCPLPSHTTAEGRTDILAYAHGRPLAVFELKRAGLPLTSDDEAQGLSYAKVLTPPIQLVVVTNGNETRMLAAYSGEAWEPTRLRRRSSPSLSPRRDASLPAISSRQCPL
jgi:hypothetical protein